MESDLLCAPIDTTVNLTSSTQGVIMKKLFAALLSIGLLPFVSASLLYSLDMTSDNTADFNKRVQIGRIGSDNFNAGNFVYQTDTYLLQGRFGNGVPLALNQGGTAGVYSGDTQVSLTFTYAGTTTLSGEPAPADPSNTIVAISTRGAKGGDALDTWTANNYPIYYGLIQEGVFSIVKKWGFDNTTQQSTLGSYALQAGEISSTDNYRFTFGTFDQGSDVNVFARLYQNDSLISSLSFLDDGTVGGAPFTSGYVGLHAGQSGYNTGDFMGIEIDSFTVSIPEPGTLALVVLSGLSMLLVFRRKRG